MRPLAALLSGLLLWSAASPSLAADRCRPVLTLAAQQVLTVASDQPGVSVWLEAKLMQPFEVDGLALGLRPDQTGRLKQDALLRGQALGRGKIEGDLAELRAADPDGEALLKAAQEAGARRVAVRVVDHVARDLAGAPLKLSPSLEDPEVVVEVAAGAPVRGLDANRVAIQPGATLRWRGQPGRPLRMYLGQLTRVAETTASDLGHAATLKPAHAPAEGRLRVTVSAAGLDLSGRAPAFCLMGHGLAIEAPAQFVKQENDQAVFDLRLSREAAHRLRAGSGLWDRLGGVPVELRILAYADQQPVLDQRMTLRITSVSWSATAGLALLLVLYLSCAAGLRRGNPFAVAGLLIQQPDGRFSLSNLQVLLWTLLVLFSMTFAWASTGELPVLSTSVLGMLGIAGASSVLARGVERMDPANAAGAPPVQPDKKDLVADKDGNFDLLRFQMLGFTLFSLLYSLVSVLRSDGLPELPESLYWLMGISNTTYVAGKVPPILGSPGGSDTSSSAAGAGAVDAPQAPTSFEATLAADRIKKLQQAVGAATTGVVDAATREAIKRYQTAQALYPVNGLVTAPLLMRLGI